LNFTYIRDFDALQVNATPTILAFVGTNLVLSQGFKYSLFGITITLIADSFFALRFEEKEDTIHYTPLELFSLESWT